MPAVKIFCKDCGNDGSPNGGIKDNYGFAVEIFSATIANMESGDRNRAICRGYEPVSQPYKAIFDAYKNGEIKCLSCGGTRIDVVCEIDQMLEREEQELVDSIDVDTVAGEITSIETNTVPTMPTAMNSTDGSSGGRMIPIESSGKIDIGQIKIDLEV